MLYLFTYMTLCNFNLVEKKFNSFNVLDFDEWVSISIN